MSNFDHVEILLLTTSERSTFLQKMEHIHCNNQWNSEYTKHKENVTLRCCGSKQQSKEIPDIQRV